MTPSVDVLNSLSFAGATLSPLFLQDPRTGSAGALFEALSLLNADEATAEWPLADKTEAQEGLDLIVAGLKASRATEADGAFCAEDKLVDEYRRLFIGPAQKTGAALGLRLYRPGASHLRGKHTASAALDAPTRHRSPRRRPHA